MTSRILIGAGVCALLICAWWFYVSRLDKELVQAQLETAKAEEALVAAQAYTKTVQAELDEVVFSATKKITKADETIAWLESSVANARVDLKQTIAEKRILLDKINTINLESIPDAPMPEILGRVAEVYPYQDLSGVEITGNEAGRGLFQLMLLEIEKGRELILVNEKIQDGYQDQIYRLGMVIDAQKGKMLAMGEISAVMAISNEALVNENEQHVKFAQGQAAQLKIYEQKFKFNWIEDSLIAVAVVTGVVVIIW